MHGLHHVVCTSVDLEPRLLVSVHLGVGANRKFFLARRVPVHTNTTMSQRANTGPILRHIASKLTTAMKKGFASLSGSVIERTLWRLTMGKPRGSSS